MTLSIDISPMGAVRMTSRGKFVKIPAQRYLQYKKAIGLLARQRYKTPYNTAVAVRMRFYYPIPDSWPKRRKELAESGFVRPTVKPDIDNVIKGLFDALNGIAWTDDKLVVEEHSAKWYSKNPRIEVEVTPIEDLL